MAQGNFKLKKNPLKKAKPKRGDQQKLRKGCFDIKPKGQGRVASDRAASDRITKSIVQRIEQTMASRASTDGAGLQVLQTSADGSTSGAKKRAMIGKAITKKAHKRAKR